MAFLACGTAPVLASPLVAQAVIFGEEPTLDPMRIALKADVIVLRDSLASVEATSARLIRAKGGASPSVVLSSARVLQSDCVRAARAAGTLQSKMGTVGTNDARGKAVINDYNAGLADLKRSMASCDKALEVGLAGSKPGDQDPLFRVALASKEAIRKYDWKLQVLLKTLQIPLDPKGFKSAINM